MRMLLAVIAAAILAACASIGRPSGGDYDMEPPQFVGSNPAPGSVNVDRGRVTLTFDENVQLEDAGNKVVVSPAQKQTPQISANGRHVTVELRDTLLPNTTYTIDFSDAVRDLNEGNVLDGFAIDFSTGDSIDSLQISGMVLEARNLEPAQGMLVGVHSDLADSALWSKQFDRIAKTNSKGQFTVRNLKPGTYRVYAVKDINRDYKWDRSEDVAFYPVTVSPTAGVATVEDTLVTDAGTDSIVTRTVTEFLPNDLLLTWFNEEYKSQYLKNYGRPQRNLLSMEFGAPSDTLPELTLINLPDGPRDIGRWAVLDGSATRDTLQYWITDTAIARMDTLRIAARYLKTDTVDLLSWTADTLRFTFKDPKQKARKPAKRKEKDSTDVDSVPPIELIRFTASTGSTHDVYAPLVFKASEPIDTIYPDAIHLEVLVDTIWTPTDIPPLKGAPNHPLLNFTTSRSWEPGAKYRLTVDSAAIYGVSGLWNGKVTHEFTVKKLEDYAALFFKVKGLEGPGVVELLDSKDDSVRTARVEDGEAAFLYIDPGTYYARLYVDANGNGRYDRGDVKLGVQPEETYYYPKKITLKKNWDLEQAWDINELPVDAQKPEDIKKNKPEQRRSWDNDGRRRQEGTDEEEDIYDSGFGEFGGGNISGSPSFGGASTNTLLNPTRR
ncbi:MAG: Ig-like domain-containing protein [Muribaculaceae bacterium]